MVIAYQCMVQGPTLAGDIGQDTLLQEVYKYTGPGEFNVGG